jgi:hypothetical protein
MLAAYSYTPSFFKRTEIVFYLSLRNTINSETKTVVGRNAR